MILALFLVAASAPAPADATPAPSRGVVSLARPVDIREPMSGRVVAVLSDVTIGAHVRGDVVVWGGDVRFERGGSVDGNLSVFGGNIQRVAGPSLPVSGSVSTPGSLLAFYLAEMHRPPWEVPGRASVFLGLRLVALAGWLAASLGLLWFFAAPFARAAASAEHGWSRSLIAGACGVSAIFLAAAASLALLPSALSVPLVIVFAAFAVAAKIFGMAALFLLIGQKLRRNPSAAGRPLALAAGFSLLGAISLVPLAGPVIWSAASVVSVGIALSSRFGTPRYRVRLA